MVKKFGIYKISKFINIDKKCFKHWIKNILKC